MTQDAVVIKVLNEELAEVAVTRGTACGGNCGSCESCGGCGGCSACGKGSPT